MSTPKNILVVENDFLQADWLLKSLRQAFPQAGVRRIKTESGFHASFESIAQKRPDIIIMDVMLQWTEVSDDIEDQAFPERVLKEGPYRAGMRCEEMLAADKRTKNIPVILYTILERHDLEPDFNAHPNVTHLRKDSTPEPLIQLIRDVMGKR
jgi:CheY-like chemotaxis protein